MHPSLRHAVHVPGHVEPMSWGLARLHSLWRVLDAVELLDAARLDDGTVAAMRVWCREFLDWLLASDLYRAELQRANNHSTYAVALALGLAVVVDDPPTMQMAEQAATVLDAQVESDGSQPAELLRPRSYFYCGYNLAAMLRVAELAWCCGVDLLGSDGALRRALDAMLPSLVDPRRWPQKSVEPTDLGRHGDLLVRAVATWPGHSRIVTALRESRITPGRGDRVWIEAGVDPAVALDRRR
jgi:hypothetical protein